LSAVSGAGTGENHEALNRSPMHFEYTTQCFIYKPGHPPALSRSLDPFVEGSCSPTTSAHTPSLLLASSALFPVYGHSHKSLRVTSGPHGSEVRFVSPLLFSQVWRPLLMGPGLGTWAAAAPPVAVAVALRASRS